MRILIISNLFPPDFVGGYEIACCDIARGLAKCGHQIYVLTSGSGVEEVDGELCINRSLMMHLNYKTGKDSAISSRYFESHNYFVTRNALGKTMPDLVYIWSLSQITLGVAVAVQEMGMRAVYHIFDYSLTGFRQKRPLVNDPSYLKRAAAWLRSMLQIREELQALISIDHLQIDNVIFGSRYLQNEFQREGISPQQTHVVYHGVNPSQFTFERKSHGSTKHHRLLFAGRLTSSKGVHVLLEAISILKSRGSHIHNFSLTIAGDGEEAYLRHLIKFVAAHQLEKLVYFIGKVERSSMPRLFHEHDLFIFPSLWQEPFGIVIIEAMASGVPVVGTSVGGAAEILRDGENSILCKADDPADLANKISLLLADDELYARIVENAYNHVRSRFLLDKSVARIEAILGEYCQSDIKVCG